MTVSIDDEIRGAAQAAMRRRHPRMAMESSLRVADRFAEGFVVVALFGELALVLANILARLFFHRSFLWSDEVARLALSILAFVGGALAYRRREHAQVRLILSLLPEARRDAHAWRLPTSSFSSRRD